MVFTRRQRQQNKMLFSQLGEKDTFFMIGQSNQDEQIESGHNMICRGTSLDHTSNPTQVNYSQRVVRTLEEDIVSEVRSEVDNAMTSVKTRVQDAVLTAIENSVIFRWIDGWNWP